MVTDQPLVVYPEDREKPVTKKRMDDFYDRWASKRNGENMKGKTISLGDYLKKKNIGG